MHSVITKARIRIFLIFLLSVMLLSCGSPEKRYKVLTVFFDGVPEPGSRQEENETKVKDQSQTDKSPEQKIVIQIRSSHPDYAERNCDNCHDRSSSNFLRARSDRICFECHDEDEFKGDFIHGPAAVSDCLTCHMPHESQYDKLLIAESQGICLYCHEASDVALNPAHSGLSLPTAGITPDAGKQEQQDDQQAKPSLCTPCHDPHKGENRFFLRQSRTQTENRTTGR
jgi:predicted CXXCH cytochrome family protein